MPSGGYPLGLALQDFVPVFLTAVGLWLVARWTDRRAGWTGNPARFAAIAVTVGGLAKAAWKLIGALTEGAVDVLVLDRALFVLLAPGYLLLLVLVMVSPESPARRMWPFVPVTVWLGAVAIGAGGWDRARIALLIVAAAASVGLSVGLAIKSRRSGHRLAGALFTVHAPLVLILGGLGRAADPSITMQWVDQLLNTAAQAIFLWAAFLLISAQDAVLRRGGPNRYRSGLNRPGRR